MSSNKRTLPLTLKRAIEDGNEKLLETLLSEGVAIQNNNFDGLLFLAENVSYPMDYGNKENYEKKKTKYKNHLRILELMLENKAKNLEDYLGVSALEVFISKGAIEFVELALNYGLIPNGNCFKESCRQKDFEIFYLLRKFEPNCNKKSNPNYLYGDHPVDMILDFDEDENQWHKYVNVEDVEDRCTAHPRLYALVYKLIINKKSKSELKKLLDEYLIGLEKFYNELKVIYPPEDKEKKLLELKQREEEFNKRINEKIRIVAEDLHFLHIKNNKEALTYVREKYYDLLLNENFNVMKWVATEAFQKAMRETIPLYLQNLIDQKVPLIEIADRLKTTERKLKNFILKIDKNSVCKSHQIN
ncbi:hypothetical protein [Acinetobacter beijerinckii]|uniref:hypothetical protein n=1 Tax=Acinetobacter beijerinckii TaxID=262668 RepID=UPI0024069375|nr:hypothetical protein [Acinetobacter beijerinckii]